jgi:hypothetical protein
MEMSPFEEMKVRMIHEIDPAIRRQVHTVDFVAAAVQQTFAEVVADKTVDAQNQDAFLRAFRVTIPGRPPKRMPSTSPNSSASWTPPRVTLPLPWPVTTSMAPWPQRSPKGLSESIVARRPRVGLGVSRTDQKKHRRLPIWLKAPG